MAAWVWAGEAFGPASRPSRPPGRNPADGTWLADVGFGDHSVYSITWETDSDQSEPGGTFRLEEQQNGDIDLYRNGCVQYRIETHPGPSVTSTACAGTTRLRLTRASPARRLHPTHVRRSGNPERSSPDHHHRIQPDRGRAGGGWGRPGRLQKPFRHRPGDGPGGNAVGHQVMSWFPDTTSARGAVSGQDP